MTKFARLVKLPDVTPKAAVSALPNTLPSMKLEICKLISMPNTVASTPCRPAQYIMFLSQAYLMEGHLWRWSQHVKVP